MLSQKKIDDIINDLAPSTARRIALAGSAVVFAEALGFKSDPWQKQVLRTQNKRILLNCARQSGKSSVVAILALHHALYIPNSMVLVISHTLQQSAETFKKIIDYYKQIGRPVLAITETVHRVELQNGSRVITLTGQRPDSIRGFSGVSMLIVDEAALVPDEAYYAARPMLAVSGGRVIILSTPHGAEGFFYDTWENGDEWLKIKINATQCPRLTPKFLAEEKAIYPDYWYAQEYMNEFIEGVSSVFSVDDIDRAFVKGIYARDDIDLSLD